MHNVSRKYRYHYSVVQGRKTQCFCQIFLLWRLTWHRTRCPKKYTICSATNRPRSKKHLGCDRVHSITADLKHPVSKHWCRLHNVTTCRIIKQFQKLANCGLWSSPQEEEQFVIHHGANCISENTH